MSKSLIFTGGYKKKMVKQKISYLQYLFLKLNKSLNCEIFIIQKLDLIALCRVLFVNHNNNYNSKSYS